MTWKERLKLAKQTGSFTAEDKELVRYYGSCAIGEKLGFNDKSMELHAKILYSLNERASNLGYRFARNVGGNKVGTAYKIYLEIQKLTEVAEQ